MKKHLTLIVLLAGFSILFLTLADAFAAGEVRAEGTLTSIENDGSVVIDKHGYMVDNSTVVLNRYGKRISLKRLALPVKVCFKYEYTGKGPVIRQIRELSEEMPQ